MFLLLMPFQSVQLSQRRIVAKKTLYTETYRETCSPHRESWRLRLTGSRLGQSGSVCSLFRNSQTLRTAPRIAPRRPNTPSQPILSIPRMDARFFSTGISVTQSRVDWISISTTDQ